ncbi:hypothetical protein Ahy_B06g084566 [Arachis hypogaea]|uniref:non-specific serine/threonine protein kinase n=1 Tax=Arachis hypogaea TaxID=3818 RepID=A0A444YSA4_ARAHY|nr:hypothetical protein Ahy_B06g084566 [Arachis hypogaea]
MIGILDSLCDVDLSNNNYNDLPGNLPIALASIPHINLSFNFFECSQGCKDFYAKSMIGNTPMSVNFSVQDQNTKKSRHLEKNSNLFFIWNYDGKIAFEDIIEATQDFDIKYCIATGAYDYVCRVQLSNGKIFALKKLGVFMDRIRSAYVRYLSESDPKIADMDPIRKAFGSDRIGSLH